MRSHNRHLYHPSYQLERMADYITERRERIIARRAKPPTRVPCPTCQTPQDPRIYYYPKGECCDDCLMVLWKAEDELSANRARRDAAETETLAVQPSWPHLFLPRGDRDSDAAAKAIENKFRDMLKILTLDRVEPRGETTRGRIIKASRGAIYSEGRNALEITVPVGSGDFIDGVSSEISAALAAIYEAGVEKGSSLIARLASGEITIGEFDSRERKDR